MLEGTEGERACSALGTEVRPRRLKLVSEGESGTLGCVTELRIYSKIPKYQDLEFVPGALNILSRVLK